MKNAMKLATIQAICIHELNPDVFYFYSSDGILHLNNISTGIHNIIAKFPEMISANSQKENKQSCDIIEMNYFHGNISMVQKFGLNAVVYNTKRNKAFHFGRTDYHANQSKFSHTFLIKDDHILFLHQNEWNRLDLFDLTNEKNLTERIVQYGNAKDGSEKINYFDYFHSSIIKSPDDKHFISNGWHWGPYDTIYVFNVDAFIDRFELSNCKTEELFTYGYNWDRPCTFICNDKFVVAQDKDIENSEEPYAQLLFYQTIENAEKIIPYKRMDVELFNDFNKEGKISGNMYYSKLRNSLIALEKNVLRLLDLETQQTTEKELLCASEYQFSKEHQLLYRYDDTNHEIFTYKFEDAHE